MKSKPLSMKKLYILLMDFNSKKIKDYEPGSHLKVSRESEIIHKFLKYVWEHKNEV